MLQSIILFYQQEYLTIRDTFQRHKLFSLLLLLVQELQFISLTIPTKRVRHNKTLSTLLDCLDYFKIYPLFGDIENYTIQMVFDIIFILSFLLMLLFLFLLYTTKQSNLRITDVTIITPIPLKLQHIEKKQLDSDLKQCITLYISLYLQLGEFIFYQVFYYINLMVLKNSINNLSNTINITGLIISLIFMPIIVCFLVFQNAHRFDFGFKNADFLGTRMAYQLNIDFVLKYSIITLNMFVEIEVIVLIIMIFYFIWKLIVGHQQYIYQNSEIQQFSCIIQGQILIFIFLVLLFYGFAMKEQELGNHFIFFFPLVLQIQRIKYRNYQSQVTSMQNLSEDKLDIAIRYLYEQSHKVFVKERDIVNNTQQIKHYSLQIHTLIIRHLRECRELGCFCFEFFPEALQQSTKSWQKYTDDEFSQINEDSGRFKDQKIFKQFLIELLKHHYEKHLANNKIVSFSFWLSYIYFLSEIVKRPTLSFFEALNLNQKSKYKSTRNRMIIEALILRTRNTFNVMIVKMDLKNQKFDLQITFSFDESIQKIKENLILIIERYKNWYGLLIFDKNNIAEIQQKGQELKKAINVTQNQLNATFQANPLSQEIETLYQLYYKYINYFQKRNPKFKKNSKLTNNYLKSNQKEVFAKDSFIIYISLLNPVGKILKYTSSFIKMSGHQETTQISNIRTYIPDMLAIHHDMYLMNFVQKGRMNIVKSEHRFLLIKNRNGFVVPVEGKIRLENYSTTEFGASALITRIITDNHHILLNKYGQLEEICEHLFTQFQKILKFELNQIKSIDFLMIMPQIWKMWKSKALIQEEDEVDDGLIHKNNDKEALLILPTKQREIQFLILNLATKRLSMKKYYEQSQNKLKRYFKQLDDCVLFTIRFKIIDIKTINQTAYIMEIQSMKQILRKESPQQRMLRVQNMLETQFQELINDQYLDYNLDHTLISEDNQMSEIVAQNIKITQQRITLPSDRQTNTVVFSSENQLVIPLRVIENQLSSIIHDKQKDSEEFRLNKSDGDLNMSEDQEQAEEDKVDQNSVASFSGYQDQLTKRKLIRQILLDQGTSKTARYFKVLLIANFLVTISLSMALCITIINNLMVTPVDMIIDHNVIKTEILFNSFILFSQQEYFDNEEILQTIIKESTQNTKQFQQIQSKYDLYTQIYSIVLGKNIEIFYEMVLINQHFVKDLVTNDIKDLINIHSSFEVSLTELFSKLHKNTSSYNQQQVNILISLFISAEMILGIFSILYIPIYYYFIKKNDHILSLTGRMGQKQIQKQNYLYESLIQLSLDNNFLTMEVGEGFLDTSKEKQSEIQSLTLLNENGNIRSTKITQRFRMQDQNSKGCASYSFPIFLILIFYALNSSYFFISYSLWKYQIIQINNWVQQVDDTINYQLHLSNILCQFVEFKYSQTNVLQYPISKIDHSQWIDWQIYFNQKSKEIIQINETAQINLCQYFDLQGILDLQHYLYRGINRTLCDQYQSTNKGVVIALTEILTQSHNLLENYFNYNLYNDIIINGIFIQAGLNLVYEYLFTFSIANLEQTFLISQGLILGVYLPLLGVLFYCCFTKISKSINLKLINSKELLTLFPLDLILENSSIMAFIIEESRENHNAN